MVGIYFSGTGNTRHCIEHFVGALEPGGQCLSIEDPAAVAAIAAADFVVMAYPIYFSALPKLFRDFLEEHRALFEGKRVFLLATMGLFSGDGTGCCARLLRRYGATIAGGVHLKMPDCIGDEKALKKTVAQNRALVRQAEEKLTAAAAKLIANQAPREGLGVLSHLAGLFGQRLWFYAKTLRYSDKLKVRAERCVGCGVCVGVCPMKNLSVSGGMARGAGRCTMCYRCVNCCPQRAITLLGREVYEQCGIERYL